MDELEARMSGVIFGRDQADYNSVCTGFYPGFRERPQWVAMCADESDVTRCLEWARDRKVPFAVRSGGHSSAGYSASEGLVIDVSKLNAIQVDREARTAWIGAGARLGDVTQVLDAHGLHVPAGSCAQVGISGFMQGGGYGYTSRMFGIHCDSAVEVRILLSDGRTVHASAEENSDLFWAVRGGTGGNFGILLQTRYRLHPLDEVWVFALQWDVQQAPQVISEIQARLMKGVQHPELGFMLNLCRKDGQPSLLMQGLYVGPRSSGLDIVGRLDGMAGRPLLVDRVVRYPAGVDLLDSEPFAIPDFPADWAMKDHLVFKEAGYVARDVPVSTWEQAVDCYVRGSGEFDMVVLEPYGGNIRNVPVDENAFMHRQVDFNIYGNVFVRAQGCDLLQARKWLDDAFVCLEDCTNGHRYQNYPRRNLDNYRWAYWGESYPALERIKKKYDPEGLFRFEQDLHTSA